jgi:glycosyltransferase involved in cell wall biosynthesis
MQGLEDYLADKDLIYSADITYFFSLQAIQAKSKFGCKVVCLEWENIPFIHEEHEVERKIKEAVRNGADHFIAVTQRAKEALMIEGVPEEKIDVIPMGVDLNTFRPMKEDIIKGRNALGIGKEEIVILFVGRIVWEKGIYDLVHAAKRVFGDRVLNRYSIRFLIVGKGPELQGVRERVMTLGISSRIIFLDEYPYREMHKLHNLADISVLPSIPIKNWQEQFGMVLVESMACGKPVVATLSGSIPEVVGDAGILIKPNDHLSIYDAIKGLILDKELREQLGKNALVRAEREFDSRKTAEKVRMVFEKVMSQKTKEDRYRENYIEGLKCWKEGNREEGFIMVCKTFEEDPDRKDVLDSIVQMGKELKRYDVIEKSLRDYLTYHLANLEVLTSLSETLLHLGKIDQAEEELRKVFIFDPDNRRAVTIMKEIKAAKGGIKV